MKQSKRILTVYVLLMMFFLYFVSILFESNLWGNILSPVVAFLSSVSILISIEQIKRFRSYAVLLFLSTLIWGVADFFWLIYDNILSLDPANVCFINILYVVPNLFFAILLTHYILKNYPNWNLNQLFIDIFTFSAIGTILLWSFIFSETKLTYRWDFDYILAMIYIFLDFYLIVALGLICFSKSLGNIRKSSFLVLTGIFLYAMTDYYYAYLSLMKSYEPNTIIDVVYMLCNVLFAVGTAQEAADPIFTADLHPNELSENLRKPTKLVFLNIVFFHLLHMIGFLSLNALVFASAICVLYWILTTNVRANMVDKLMLKTEKNMNEQLEKLIAERTLALNLANQHLKELSNRDALTGLYNRRYLINYLDYLVTSDSSTPFALLYIDFNRFKFINDSYGHEMGDKVLCALCRRILETHIPNCIAFRLGGDEFAVLLENYADKTDIALIAEQLLKIIQTPVNIDSYVFTLNASIGIALYPKDTDNRDILMQYADMAMYEVKSRHYRVDYLFFNAELSEKTKRQHEIELALRNADYDKEFILYFQPQYNVKTDSLVGMEALIRWMQPQKGLIDPMEFIPIAEKNGLIFNLGEWVIDKAFSQIKKWNQTYSLDLKISINISPIQIENVGFMDWFREKLQKEAIKPSWIDLEITENIAIKSDALTIQIFDLLHEMGVYTSIDDFGTGYSSLSYIKRFNIDRLKIAKELIDNIGHDEDALLIVQAIIMMAKGMQLKTIAEGIEDINQLKILSELGCDEIQGYFFGKPVTSETFEAQHINKVCSSSDKIEV